MSHQRIAPAFHGRRHEYRLRASFIPLLCTFIQSPGISLDAAEGVGKPSRCYDPGPSSCGYTTIPCRLDLSHWAFLAASLRLGAVDAFFSMSAAHKAAPTVFVNAKTRLAKGIISKRNATIPKLKKVNFMSRSFTEDLRSVSATVLFYVRVLLTSRPLLQLKVPSVSGRTVTFPLKDDKNRCANDRDEVEWKVEEVSDYRIGCESGFAIY